MTRRSAAPTGRDVRCAKCGKVWHYHPRRRGGAGAGRRSHGFRRRRAGGGKAARSGRPLRPGRRRHCPDQSDPARRAAIRDAERSVGPPLSRPEPARTFAGSRPPRVAARPTGGARAAAFAPWDWRWPASLLALVPVAIGARDPIMRTWPSAIPLYRGVRLADAGRGGAEGHGGPGAHPRFACRQRQDHEHRADRARDPAAARRAARRQQRRGRLAGDRPAARTRWRPAPRRRSAPSSSTPTAPRPASR